MYKLKAKLFKMNQLNNYTGTEHEFQLYYEVILAYHDPVPALNFCIWINKNNTISTFSKRDIC
jgi:hypothetical protein